MTTQRFSRTKKLLAERILKNQQRISEWYMEQARATPPPFYSSIDLRDSGDKIVPVDSNLFPAGFNNICPEDLRTAPAVLRAYLDAYCGSKDFPQAAKVLIVPESHTSNLFYLENLHYLRQIFSNAGFDTRIGWYGAVPEGATIPLQLKSATGKEIVATPLEVKDAKLFIPTPEGEFVPDLILLNNDFSSGYPKIFDGLRQPVVPNYRLGWHSRKKSEHFRHYNALAGEMAAILDIDPWIIQIETEAVEPVNFDDEEGIETAAQAVEKVLRKTQEAYDRYKIARKPFCFVKNNAGTYGMGIMVVHSADELRHMNRRTKHKMSVGKNKMPIHSLAIQEGVPTATTVDRLPAEPVIYLLGTELIGGFLRASTEKGDEDNLNSQGMVFKKLCMSDLRELEQESAELAGPESSEEEARKKPVLEIVYGTIARISALATGRELAAFRSPPAGG